MVWIKNKGHSVSWKRSQCICTLCEITRASLKINSFGIFRKAEYQLDQRKQQIWLPFAMLHSNNFSETNGLVPNRGFSSVSANLVFVSHQLFYFICCFNATLQLRWSCSATTEFLQGLVSLDSIYFVFWTVPVALPHTVRLIRRLHYHFIRSW